jgi:uncharacterized C2H2 Zn-finger protein
VRKKMQEKEHRELAEKEKKRLSEFHCMRCPKCGMELSEPMMYRKHIVAALLPLTVL